MSRKATNPMNVYLKKELEPVIKRLVSIGYKKLMGDLILPSICISYSFKIDPSRFIFKMVLEVDDPKDIMMELKSNVIKIEYISRLNHDIIVKGDSLCQFNKKNVPSDNLDFIINFLSTIKVMGRVFDDVNAQINVLRHRRNERRK